MTAGPTAATATSPLPTPADRGRRTLWAIACLALAAAVFFGVRALDHGGGSQRSTVQITPATVLVPELRFDVTQARMFERRGHYRTGIALADALTASALLADQVPDANRIYVCPNSTAAEVRLIERAKTGQTYLAQAGLTGPITAGRGSCSGVPPV